MLAKGTLPAVSFLKPLGDFNEHPGYATLAAGQQHLARLVQAVQRSRYWPESLIIITFDEQAVVGITWRPSSTVGDQARACRR